MAEARLHLAQCGNLPAAPMPLQHPDLVVQVRCGVRLASHRGKLFEADPGEITADPDIPVPPLDIWRLQSVGARPS
jgi:hypothetical protein